MLFEVGTVLSDRLDLNPVGTEVLEAIVSCPDSGQDSCIGEMMTLDVRQVFYKSGMHLPHMNYCVHLCIFLCPGK